jgi:hypothetical protein
MSRPSIYFAVLLTCASLSLGSGMGRAASATEACGQRYKICNWSCEQPVAALHAIIVCKSRCDLALIACDRQPYSTAAQDSRYSPQTPPQNGNVGLPPVNRDGN